MRPLHGLLIAFLATGCASHDAGRIVVISLVARLERARTETSVATATTRAGQVGIVAGLSRPSPPGRRARPEPVPEPERPRARTACRSEALCAFEALAVREALVRIDRR